MVKFNTAVLSQPFIFVKLHNWSGTFVLYDTPLIIPLFPLIV